MTKFLKLRHLTGTPSSPELILHQTLEQIDEIEAVMVGIRWKGERVEMIGHWSSMSKMELVFLLKTLSMMVEDSLREEDAEP